jgi:agmatine deiminase
MNQNPERERGTRNVEHGTSQVRRMPAEWEPHRATWIAWPHHEPDWPGKLGPIPWVYAEIARVIADHEPVEILCHEEAVRESARLAIDAHGVRPDRCRLHLVPTDRVWLRDSAPTGVLDGDGRLSLVNWAFNAWAKYPNFERDAAVGRAMSCITGLSLEQPRRADTGERIVLEGGGIEVNGRGLMLVTEEWLLSDVQVRNPGLGRAGYERIFAEWLGIERTIWLGEGCVGDDTHGHIDDIARFVTPDTIVLAVEEDPADENHARSIDNLRRLERASAGKGVGPLRIVKLPFPRPVVMNGERLPASYANFYIANDAVLVPTFNDRNDRVALNTLAELMPGHRVIGIHAVDLVWGLGTLHCLTQQEPSTNHLIANQ